LAVTPARVKPFARVARLSPVLELRRAIPFLAIPVLAFALAILVSGCAIGSSPAAAPSSPPPSPPAPSPTPVAEATNAPKPTEKLDRIGRNRARWDEAGIDSYRIALQYGCFCEFGDGRPVDVRVVEGEVVDVVADGKPVRKRQWQGFPMTVEALFDRAEAAKADADEFDVEFDRELGYPTMISVDHDRNADDDEFQVDVTSLTSAR
jgi:hypothetical protein